MTSSKHPFTAQKQEPFWLGDFTVSEAKQLIGLRVSPVQLALRVPVYISVHGTTILLGMLVSPSANPNDRVVEATSSFGDGHKTNWERSFRNVFRIGPAGVDLPPDCEFALYVLGKMVEQPSRVELLFA